MLKAKPRVCNIYALSIKQQRLKICASFLFLCLIFANCAKKSSTPEISAEKSPEISQSAVNINTASIEELEKLPHIGKEYAQRIVEYREKYGAFRRAEELMLVRGMSDKKFREIRNFVKVE